MTDPFPPQEMPSAAEALFGQALALPESERSAFLDRACGRNRELNNRVHALLAAHQSATRLIDVPASASGLLSAQEEKPGEVIGRYKLLQKIGEGGCGTVWMAEQDEPVRRRVALKVIKLGMDTKAVVARFQAERQALALMDHPNIAKVYDAGATERGRPFFVMELVRGVPLTRYCDDNQLAPRDRLELFIKVCHAIQHAHQKGIIHRDLKPSNILVTITDGEPTPKIIDFGIAKATQGRLTDDTLFTAFEQFMGTPAYMSPEQADMSSADIDTRSDIYSLGVLLYELLTGQPPFDPRSFARAGVDKIRQQIRENEPARPSARWHTLSEAERTTVAHQRRTVPAQLSAVLRGDVDWIVMRCLEKDRKRRYETANGLAMDIRRYLANEPVTARPPSTVYLLQKLIRRHRMGFGVTTMLILVVVTGAIVAATQATRALRAERREAELREIARQEQLTAATARLAAQEEQQRSERQRWARQHLLPEIDRLIRESDYIGAYDRAVEAEKYLADDPALAALWPSLSMQVSLHTDPEGAEIYAKPYLTPEAEWQLIGTTPVKNARVARTAYRWLIKKNGYATLERAKFPAAMAKTTVALLRSDFCPQGMLYFPGRTRSAEAAIASPGAKKVSASPNIGPFFIDKFEVTNREYKEFVDRGGYATAAYWRQPFIEDGKTLSWSEALSRFRDSTGRPGPSTWREGTFPPGQAEFPVSGVSWFEAAAFAEFAGKRLPSIHHWLLLARPGKEQQVRLANVDGQGPWPVGRSQCMAVWGEYDMMGNVKEWCWNERESGLRHILGGSWSEPSYVFEYPDAQSPWNRAMENGFRCIKILNDTDETTELDQPYLRETRDFTNENPVNDEVFNAYRNFYSYESGPLAAKVESVDDSSPLWRKERVLINAAYGDARLPVVLFLPKQGRPPYQAIIYFPASGAINIRGPIEGERRIGYLVESGRAVVYPIYDGTYDRGEGDSSKYVHNANVYPEFVTHCSKDLGRTIDYLETRADIRSDQLGFVGRSLGAVVAPMLLAVEPRVRAAVLVSGGIRSDVVAPQVDQINFAPRVRIPVLMLGGRYDSLFTEPSQRQLFRVLGTPPEDKRHILYDSSHSVSNEAIAKDIPPWFDRYLGPVK